MLLLAAYLFAGVLTFFGLRSAFKKAHLDSKDHDKIWMSWLRTPEGWLFAIPFWPYLVVASLLWFLVELLHSSGKKEMMRREEAEAARDSRFDHLTLDQKLDLLKAEAQRKGPNRVTGSD